MPSVRENLIAAKALIDTPEKWGKGAMSRAGALCSVGALGVASCGGPFGWRYEDLYELQKALPKAWRWNQVASFNDDDETTHADIMALFDRAIAASSNEEIGV